jgi:hypothetical protein
MEDNTSAKTFVRKPTKQGNSIIVAIAPPLVRRLAIDNTLYFEEFVNEEGLLILKPRRLQ